MNHSRASARALVALMAACLASFSVGADAQSKRERPETPQRVTPSADRNPAREPGADDLEAKKDALSRKSEEAFDKNDYKAAEAAIRELIEIDADNFVPWYNLACALSMQNRTEEAGPALEKAIALGFSDLVALRSDPHMAALRRTPNYKRLASKWGDILDARIDASLDALKKSYGPRYSVEKNETLRLAYVSAFAPSSFELAKVEIDRLTAWWETNVAVPVTGSVLNREAGAASGDASDGPTGEGAEDDAGADADANRKEDAEPRKRRERKPAWVIVLLPTQNDYASWALAKFGPGWQRIGGSYSHDEKKLVAKDLGSTLRHEYWHVLHWRDMSARRQTHPIWIMEGLCSLPEDVEVQPGDEMKPIPSWRTNQARHLAKSGKLFPLEQLFETDQKRFVGTKPLAYYAQSRCIFLYLWNRGKLKEWYTAYVDGYSEDRTGARAMEKVLGKPLAEIQKDFAAWLRSLPEVQEEFRPGDAVLPFNLEEGSGDGVLVASAVSMRSKSKGAGGVRMRDVITAVDGKPVREMGELIQVLQIYVPGTEVEVSYRRGKITGTAKVTLATYK